MQDHKMAAAHDQENLQEIESGEKLKKRLGVGLDYAHEVLVYLMSFTQANLTPDDQEAWTDRLSKVPAWKLKRLDEFTSPFINEVWKFLDGLQQEIPAFKALPEADNTPRHISIAKDFNDHVRTVMNFDGTREERLRWEWESFKKLDKKYPHLNVLSQVRGEKRFQEMSR